MKDHGTYDWYYKNKLYPEKMRIERKRINRMCGTRFRSARKAVDFFTRRYCMGHMRSLKGIDLKELT